MASVVLVVSPSALVFGCMKARDMRGNDANIILYENLRQRYVDNIPQAGDMLLCRHRHSTVYIPLCRVSQTALCLRGLPLSLPNDILTHYFPLTEPLRIL